MVPYSAHDGRLLSSTTSASTTFAPGIRSKAWTILNIACRATAPSGMPVVLIPLYRIIYGMVLKNNRQTTSAATTKLIVIAGAVVSIKALWEMISPSLMHYLTCSMSFPTEHQTARRMQAWIAAHVEGVAKRHISFLSGQVKFNKATREYEWYGDMMTAMVSGWFWFEGRPIKFEFLQKQPDSQDFRVVRETEFEASEWDVKQQLVRISTPGWSGAVLQHFAKHVSIGQGVDDNSIILFELQPDTSYYGEKMAVWKHRVRASRPLETIDLDDKIRSDLIADIDLFMQGSREKWYGDRGIPYRRGYMFFGPPGTGKTSVCHALAGKYNSSLYIMSLNEVTSEQHLKKLFRSPQKGDILLLEDIDSAGIVRENMRNEKTNIPRISEATDLAKALKKLNAKDIEVLMDKAEETKPKITLSGVLSAIDGLPNGVVLVVTSNEPESLEKALIRPGRIDKQVLFGNVSQAVAKSIFIRMYQSDSKDAAPSVPTVTQLNLLGDTFSSHIPELKLTPAEIQGFLIEHSGEPDAAIADVDQWIIDLLAAKEAGKNIVGDDAEGNAARGRANINSLLKRVFWDNMVKA